MMRQPTTEEIKLCEKLLKTDDPDERSRIRSRLGEIAKEQNEALKDYPFVH